VTNLHLIQFAVTQNRSKTWQQNYTVAGKSI